MFTQFLKKNIIGQVSKSKKGSDLGKMGEPLRYFRECIVKIFWIPLAAAKTTMTGQHNFSPLVNRTWLIKWRTRQKHELLNVPASNSLSPERWEAIASILLAIASTIRVIILIVFRVTVVTMISALLF